jgi:hypothetical protein
MLYIKENKIKKNKKINNIFFLSLVTTVCFFCWKNKITTQKNMAWFDSNHYLHLQQLSGTAPIEVHKNLVKNFIESGEVWEIQSLKDYRENPKWKTFAQNFNWYAVEVPIKDEDAISKIYDISYNEYGRTMGNRMYFLYHDGRYPIWYQMQERDIFRLYFRYLNFYGSNVSIRGYTGTGTDVLSPDWDRINELQTLYDNHTIDPAELEELQKRKRLAALGIVGNVLMSFIPGIGELGIISEGTSLATLTTAEGLSAALANGIRQALVNGIRVVFRKVLPKLITKVKQFFIKAIKNIPEGFMKVLKKIQNVVNKIKKEIDYIVQQVKNIKPGVTDVIVDSTGKFITKTTNALAEMAIDTWLDDFLENELEKTLDEIGLSEEAIEGHLNELFQTLLSKTPDEIEEYYEEYEQTGLESGEHALEELYVSGVLMDLKTITLFRHYINVSIKEEIARTKGKLYIIKNSKEPLSPLLENILDIIYNERAPSEAYAFNLYKFAMADLEDLYDYMEGLYGDNFDEDIFWESVEMIIEDESGGYELNVTNIKILYQALATQAEHDDFMDEFDGEEVEDGLFDYYQDEEYADIIDEYMDENGQLDKYAFQQDFPKYYNDFMQKYHPDELNEHPLSNGIDPMIPTNTNTNNGTNNSSTSTSIPNNGGSGGGGNITVTINRGSGIDSFVDGDSTPETTGRPPTSNLNGNSNINSLIPQHPPPTSDPIPPPTNTQQPPNNTQSNSSIFPDADF